MNEGRKCPKFVTSPTLTSQEFKRILERELGGRTLLLPSVALLLEFS
jgi:hypothetical protein